MAPLAKEENKNKNKKAEGRQFPDKAVDREVTAKTLIPTRFSNTGNIIIATRTTIATVATVKLILMNTRTAFAPVATNTQATVIETVGVEVAAPATSSSEPQVRRTRGGAG